MGWLLIPLIIIIVIIGVAFVRNRNEQFRFGSGLFKNSEYNLDDQDEFVGEANQFDDITMMGFRYDGPQEVGA